MVTRVLGLLMECHRGAVQHCVERSRRLHQLAWMEAVVKGKEVLKAVMAVET